MRGDHGEVDAVRRLLQHLVGGLADLDDGLDREAGRRCRGALFLQIRVEVGLAALTDRRQLVLFAGRHVFPVLLPDADQAQRVEAQRLEEGQNRERGLGKLAAVERDHRLEAWHGVVSYRT